MVAQVRRLRAARRRKRRMALGQHDLNPEQWTALQIAWGGCAYCGAIDKPLQRDRVLPISRGGRYALDNVVPACAACNRSKCNDEVTGWLRRKRLDEQHFLLRHLQIRDALLTAETTLRDFSDFPYDGGRIGTWRTLSHLAAAATSRPAPHGERPQNDMMPATHGGMTNELRVRCDGLERVRRTKRRTHPELIGRHTSPRLRGMDELLS